MTAFIRALSGQVEVPVEWRDERLTSVAAQHLIHLAKTKRTKKKVRDDAIAAAIILQGYLDEQ